MAIKYVFAKDAAGLEKIQASAVRSVAKAREQVQIAAVATIKHAHEHGDWTFAQRLVDALGNTINGAALVEWFKVYGGLETNDNKKKIDALPEEDKAKVKLVVNDATIRAVLALCNFEAIMADDEQEEEAA